MKKLILLTTLCFTINSCKEKASEKQVEESINQVQNDLKNEPFFSFTMKANFENDDRIYLYYLTPEVTEITAKNSMYIDVFGSSNEQQVNFDLPKEILPTRVFIKFGENGMQKIKVRNVKLSYGENDINIPDSLFIQFFNPNKSVIYNKEDYSLEANKINNQSPMFYSRTVLEYKIDLTFM